MNKQELLESIEIMGSEVSENYPHDQVIDRELVIKLIEELDEIEKVVIPQFVADHIRFTEDDVSPRISMGEAHISKELNVWLAKTEDYMTYPNQEKFMRAWLYGYEIEKEPVYYVEFIRLESYLCQEPDGRLWVTSVGLDMEGAYKGKMRFTEKEIKDYDERYWAFSVEVTE